MDHISVDAVALWRHIQGHEKELLHKRKFLMGLEDVDSTDHMGRFYAGKVSMMPESILRKDDVFYEEARSFVEKSFLQAFDSEARQHPIDDDHLCEMLNMSKYILLLLDDLSNEGMCLLAKIVTRGLVVFDKTRPRMKRVIKDSLKELHSNRLNCNVLGQMQDELFQLLKDPKNFQQNYGKHTKITRKSLQAFDSEARQHSTADDDHLCEMHNMSKYILLVLDDLSNKGMCLLAKILTRGLVVFNKTRPRMKRVIKDSLQELHNNWSDCNVLGQMQDEIFLLLNNPKNFHQNYGKHTKVTRKSLHNALNKVKLESFPIKALYAMYRTLKGTQGVMLQSRPCRSGWSKDRLCEQVQMLWVKMIDQHDESHMLQDSLVKAMAIPGLYSKIASNSQYLSLAKFVHVSPEKEALQNEIVKAIKSLSQIKLKKEELKNLQLLLDPESKVDVYGGKKVIKSMLTDCLFECSYMDAVPPSLIDVLSLINKKSCNIHRFSLKDVIDEEVEYILIVSAHTKQLVWDCVPFDKLEQNFVEAYMEDLEESDDGDIFDDDDPQTQTNSLDEVQIRFNESITGDSGSPCSSSATYTCKDNLGSCDDIVSSPSVRAASFSGKDECMGIKIHGDEFRSTVVGDGSFSFVPPMLHSNSDMTGGLYLPNPMSKYLNNHYVAIQEMCDQASLVAYQVIGQVLMDFGQSEALGLNSESKSYLRHDFARTEHFQESDVGSNDIDASDPIIVRAVQKVIPSFSKSQLEMVKKFMKS
ncbi:uncharacterized protein LOC130798533 isoform X1 [Amaranthus tricolor]|uniref:uncharacterized protein LOC130798533 isoform X1 n=1 Tax=Amaranthus tricolor TaxID=29722 RepID=UPI00258EDFFF|nr:uncharacterized protein LOC130798533 isoform X1 [Amaranthus tricolor]XP_057517543.1 uncharacterized protein LOC130798533 isoform X1 [Amaranthus tricolor]XP_057517544.1 uncharacterized protein LOC130798533 isoform X1 [Amaranthus tricolor]XP_057517545.1 uncharacterized protein LOC130798533 isoform X1 [Amaranthus tricolor]XP_057517546.1 uncharacterized protein LOC130798533 isoform X1 [Amaranthus tricolor]XP_057517547.1 uncharacterized protein LOC130798533 isoform X1 [Amaranthus tricolor]